MTELKANTGVEGLRSTEPGARVFTTVTYFLMWGSSLICAHALILGQGLLPPNGVLNFSQGVPAVLCLVQKSNFLVSGNPLQRTEPKTAPWENDTDFTQIAVKKTLHFSRSFGF